jgi:hypothetical protein
MCAGFANSSLESAPCLVKEEAPKTDEAPFSEKSSAEDKKAAETAAEVSETAAKIDRMEEA